MRNRIIKRSSLPAAIFLLIASCVVTVYFASWTIIASLFKPPQAKINHIIRGWSATLLRLASITYTVKNSFLFEANKKYIVMCNHNSVYDIPLSFMAIDGTLRMVAKKELSRIPFLGRSMKMANFIFIDRKNREQALKDLELAKQKMLQGIIIGIFPEGRRSRDGKLLPLKKGGFVIAIETGATIIPLGIRGTQELLQPHSIRVLRNHHIDMVFGKPIDASAYTLENRQALMDAVEAEIKVAAGLN